MEEMDQKNNGSGPDKEGDKNLTQPVENKENGASGSLKTENPGKKKDTVTINKRTLWIIVIVVLLVGLIIAVAVKKSHKEKAAGPLTSLSDSDTTLVDSTKVQPQEQIDPSSITKCYVIANETSLKNDPGAGGNGGPKVKFGSILYAFNYDKAAQFTQVFQAMPSTGSEMKYYINTSALVDEDAFQQYKTYFSLPPFSRLNSKAKKLILDNSESNGVQYTPSQNASRAQSCIAFCDIDGDGAKDAVIILDNGDLQKSKLLVICTNKATKEPYLAFGSDLNDYYTVKAFKRGTAIYENSSEAAPSTGEGAMLYSGSNEAAYAVVWNNAMKKYALYSQQIQNNQ